MLYFAASTDTPDANRSFASSLHLDYPVLSDPGGHTARAYAVRLPFGVASRATFYIGSDGTLRAVDRAVRTSSAGADIAARLAALGVPRR